MGLDKLQEKAVVRIIDDDDSMRKSWRFLIEGEGGTTKCYSSALRFLEEDDRNELGCVVLDVRMPDERNRTSARDDAPEKRLAHYLCFRSRRH